MLKNLKMTQVVDKVVDKVVDETSSKVHIFKLMIWRANRTSCMYYDIISSIGEGTTSQYIPVVLKDYITNEI